MSNAKIVRIQALMTKEFHQIVRDFSSVMIAVVLPCILLFVYGYGISLDIKNLKTGILLQDHSPTAKSFVESLQNSSYFKVFEKESESELASLVEEGKLKGFIIIPSYFTQFWNYKDQRAPLYAVADGSDPNTASFTQNYLTTTFNNWQNIERADRRLFSRTPISVSQRFWYNPEVNSRYFLLPGSIAIIMTLTGTILTALVIAREWERGTMEALMTTPMTMGELITAKVSCYFLMGFGSMIICTFAATVLFGIPLHGSLLVLALVSSFFLFTALGMGLLISILAKNQFVAAQVAQTVAFLPAFMLSGFIFEIASMPAYIRAITYLIPAKYFVSSLLTIFLTGTVWQLHLTHIAFMATYALILFVLMYFLAKKRLD